MLKFGAKQLFCGILLIILLNLPVTHGDVYQHSNVTDIFDPMESIEHPFDQLVTTLATATTSDAEKAFVSNIYYISPNGSNANSGKELSKPWKTFEFAIPSLHPGDTLIMLDGIYQKDITGLPYINCDDTKYANQGTKTAPITIRAQNERQAFLKSDGSASALLMKNCSHWNVTGLRGASADLPEADGGKLKSVFTITRSNHVTLKRLLSTHSNRYFNAHTYEISNSSNILIEESEAYYFHRHGFDVYQSHHVTIRRSYVNSRGYKDLPDGYPSDRPGGDESYVFYRSSDSIVENSIAEFETRGFEVHGGPGFDGSPGGHNNKFLGNIHLNGHYGGNVDSRKVDGIIFTAENNVYRDFLIVSSLSNAIKLRSSVGTLIENVTIYNVGGSGIRADDKDDNDPFCNNIPKTCSFSLLNSLVFNNEDYGVRIETPGLFEWTIEYSNITNNGGDDYPETEDISDEQGRIRNSLSIKPTGIGLEGNQTIVYIPQDSNMSGAGKDGTDIGANILYRYKNGILSSEPLWSPTTGAYPCGALVPGINDVIDYSCFDVHERLNVNRNTLPPGYGVILYDNYSYLPFILESTH